MHRAPTAQSAALLAIVLWMGLCGELQRSPQADMSAHWQIWVRRAYLLNYMSLYKAKQAPRRDACGHPCSHGRAIGRRLAGLTPSLPGAS